jgi:hypothetical protein
VGILPVVADCSSSSGPADTGDGGGGSTSAGACTADTATDLTADDPFTIDGTSVNVAVPSSQTVSGKSPGFAPATYAVHCDIHTSMGATVIVV